MMLSKPGSIALSAFSAEKLTAALVDSLPSGAAVALAWEDEVLGQGSSAHPPGAGDLQEQASWLVTLVDPEPGTYRLTGRVSPLDAAAQPSSSGDVEVLLEVTPHGGQWR